MRRIVESHKAYFDHKENWHPWFAWYPVRVYNDDATDHRVWLETIERKHNGSAEHGAWAYRMRRTA